MVATMVRVIRPSHGSKHLVPAEMGAGGIWSFVTTPQKARDPWLHRDRMCPVGKSSGINTPWLPPMSNQSCQL